LQNLSQPNLFPPKVSNIYYRKNYKTRSRYYINNWIKWTHFLHYLSSLELFHVHIFCFFIDMLHDHWRHKWKQKNNSC